MAHLCQDERVVDCHVFLAWALQSCSNESAQDTVATLCWQAAPIVEKNATDASIGAICIKIARHISSLACNSKQLRRHTSYCYRSANLSQPPRTFQSTQCLHREIHVLHERSVTASKCPCNSWSQNWLKAFLPRHGKSLREQIHIYIYIYKDINININIHIKVCMYVCIYIYIYMNS